MRRPEPYLAAIRAFCAYVATRDPAASALVQKILHIPFKKAVGRVVGYLAKDELEAILAQPDRTTRKGRRDYLVLALLYDSGARVQELLGQNSAPVAYTTQLLWPSLPADRRGHDRRPRAARG